MIYDIINERNDERNAQSNIFILSGMINKQALLKELQTQKQRIVIADVKKQNDLKQRNSNNLSTMPAKRKRKFTDMSVKKQRTKMRENLDDIQKKSKTLSY